MNKFTSALLLITPMLLPALSHAQEDSKIGVGLKVGTTGLAIEGTKALTKSLNLRAAYNLVEYDFELDKNSVTYFTEFDKSSVSLLVDWHPKQGGFRVSAGVFNQFNNTLSINAKATSGTYKLNRTSYNASDVGSLSGSIKFGEGVTPYFGIGWGNASKANNKVSFSLDIGVQFQDTAKPSLSVTGCTLPDILCTQLNDDVKVELEKLRRDFDGYDLWPVINIGIATQF